MKKLISSLIAMLLCMSYFSVASVADGVAPKDGTATPYGIYGVVEDIGVNPNSNPLTRSALFGAEIRLDPGKSFTSYQYEVKSSCTRVEYYWWVKNFNWKYDIINFRSSKRV